jgi:uncharacterized protein YciI
MVTVAELGFGADWQRHQERCAATRRITASRLLLSGRVVEAADAWARVSPYDEATARLHAASQLAAAGRLPEAEVQLTRGLAFFRAVGATRIIAQAEGLSAAAAAAE